ncbi:hypothetical protein EV127DRAFT_421063 [Xylaria flabelliformis]|nr:hypothetical protein EV127DRAFT_421063 [Xylaria flabelliformis]
MARYISETNLWMQACLDDEPIFCAAPSPLNSDDIICPGSDDENDEATKVARQRRYEEHGRRYLQGRPLHILSASLRGPFDKTSGWQNPWLPKPSTQRGQYLQRSNQPPLASSSRQCESGVAIGRLSSEQSDTDQDQDPDDSVECHLPSPRSHEDLQFPEIPANFDSCSRIASWAKHVEDNISEEDRFWAPNRYSSGRSVDSAKRPSTDRDWLKRQPAKRRKPNASQSTEPTSTPTPLQTVWPRPKSKKELAIGSKSVKCSFEMTTPSSSPDKGPRGSPDLVQHQAVTSYEEHGQEVPSTASAGGIHIPSEPGLSIEQGEEKINGKEKHVRKEYENEEESQTAGASDAFPGQLHELTFRSEETIDFEDCADESFCYRARHMKQVSPPMTSNATVTDRSSPHIQTAMLTSPKRDDAVMVSSSPGARESRPSVISSHLDTKNARHAEISTGPSIAGALNDEAEFPIAATRELDLGLPQCNERVPQRRSIVDINGDTTYAAKAITDGPLSDITSSRHISRLNIRNTIPETLKEANAASNTNVDWSFDEEPTLIGDSLDTEELGDIEHAQQDPGHNSECTSLLQHYAISATNLANSKRMFQCDDISTLKRLSDTTSSTAAEVTQQEAAKLQPAQIGRCPQKEGKPNSSFSADTIVSRDDRDISDLMAEDQTISAEQQSPWAPLYVVDESDQLSNNEMERAGNSHRESMARATTMLLNMPASIHDSPTVRPSQQSPWAKKVSQSMNKTRLEESIGVETAVILDIVSPGEFQTPLLLANQEHTAWSGSSPAILPVPENSSRTAHEQQYVESDIFTKKGGSPVQNLPHTPTPQVARQSTPDGEVSIRSFSNFNFSSSQQSDCHPSNSAIQGILSNRKRQSARTSTRSNRRVSFALLDYEEEDINQPPTKLRAASPPPPLVDLEGEDIDGRYRNHFDIMNRSLSVHKLPNLQYQRRLLPSSSQQKPESPSIGAMADAFREADTHLLSHVADVIEGTEVDRVEAEVKITEEMPQSPWQHDSQGIDDVAAVLGNLHDFLDVWDVDTEMDRNRAKLDEAERDGFPSNNDISISQGVGIW